MNTIALYDRVCLTAPLSPKEFVAYFNDTVTELITMFGDKYVCDGEYTELVSVNDGSNVYDMYSDAIVNNIIFLKTGNTDRKTDFLYKANKAYQYYWHKSIKKKQIKLRRIF